MLMRLKELEEERKIKELNIPKPFIISDVPRFKDYVPSISEINNLPQKQKHRKKRNYHN